MKRFLLSICLSLSFLQGEIIETAHFKEITNHVHPDTLVILDIDDTLLIPAQTLGSDVWFISRLNQHLQTKKDYHLALDRALAEWEAIRHITDVKIVEEGIQEIIDSMQKNQVVMMGLTTQGLALATRTAVQLKSLSIDLTKTAPSHDEHFFINGPTGVLFRKGILFTSGTAKGEALIKLLDTIHYTPKHIVFINDKKTHLHDVERSVEARNIHFTGLRYSYSDERVANFCKELADVQWRHSTLEHLLSDEEAATLLNMD